MRSESIHSSFDRKEARTRLLVASISSFGRTEMAGGSSTSTFGMELLPEPELKKRPNKAPEPTTIAVTPPAAQESRQPWSWLILDVGQNTTLMDETNKHGLSRYIPADVRRDVRHRSKFGCEIGRRGFYQYEHIDPTFENALKNDPSRICCLCGSCHDSISRGQI